MMDKLSSTSPNVIPMNVARIGELFPSVLTESSRAAGQPTAGIDLDLMRLELERPQIVLALANVPLCVWCMPTPASPAMPPGSTRSHSSPIPHQTDLTTL